MPSRAEKRGLVQTPFYDSQRGRLALDLICNFIKLEPCKGGLRNWSWCRTCGLRVGRRLVEIILERCDSPNTSKDCDVPGTRDGRHASLAQSPCEEVPVGFRQDIRLPDVWESAWETTWPNAREAMAFWRAENFTEVQQLWLRAAPCAEVWRAAQTAHDLPPSAQWLPALVFDTPVCGDNVPCGCPQVPDDFWSTLGAANSPQEAMTTALGFGPAVLSAERVRTGVRLMENLDLPAVHVVQHGETVYSISRLTA